jgi:mRNA-degrading endonuclease toxin of MazEF toxin-antitoxin module
MADQIATVSKQRLKKKLATLSINDVRAIERAICVQLGLFPA